MNYVKKRVSIDNVSWTAITSPIEFDGFSVKSATGTSFLIRSDSADPNTEDTVAVDSQESSLPAGSDVMGRTTRFRANGNLMYAKSTVASDTIIATFIGVRS